MSDAQELGLPRDTARWLATLGAAGSLLLAAGAVSSPERVWPNMLLVSLMAAGCGLGTLFFLAFHELTGAVWGRPLLAFAAAIARTLPFTATVLVATVLAGLHNYPWTDQGLLHAPSFWFKRFWLEPTFFAARTVLYGLIWAALAVAATRKLKRDRTLADAQLPRDPPGLWAAILVLLALTVWLATTDWIMSLEPLWYSTVFGVYQFSGLFLSALAALTVFAAFLREAGVSKTAITDDLLHDLGKLLFAFSSFWMYIWFSQYMLVWYTNIPEETSYYVLRIHGTWKPLFLCNLVLNWGVPFVILLPRPAKRSARVLLRVSLVLLVGRWLDLYLMLVPPFAATNPCLGLSEFGAIAAGVGMFGLLLLGPALKGAFASATAPSWSLSESSATALRPPPAPSTAFVADSTEPA